jgi:hypothetical protein
MEEIMADEPNTADMFWDNNYSAFQKWEYLPLITVLPDKKSWVEYGESFYHAADLLIQMIVGGHGSPDIEGIAAIFLFRHYLELALKRIVVRGRYLIDQNTNAPQDSIEEVARIHGLAPLWKLVLTDAKPKIQVDIWESYDIPFLERCISEFDERDKKGFAFRYPRHGGERYEYDFRWIQLAEEHIHHILSNMTTILIEQHDENQEWNEIQNSF